MAVIRTFSVGAPRSGRYASRSIKMPSAAHPAIASASTPSPPSTVPAGTKRPPK